MHKLAIFVEGYTELCFVDRLVAEIGNANNLAIEHKEISGGTSVPKRLRLIKAASIAASTEYYVLIFDCQGDVQVATRIREEHASLSAANYRKIIGLRDVKPIAQTDIGKLESGLRYGIKTSLIPVEFVLSVMEIEAWFLAEYTHFPRIDPRIDMASILATLGFDPQSDNMSQRADPRSDLDRCYQIANKRYEKRDAHVTVNALDMSLVYFDLRTKIPYLNCLLTTIDEFLSL